MHHMEVQQNGLYCLPDGFHIGSIGSSGAIPPISTPDNVDKTNAVTADAFYIPRSYNTIAGPLLLDCTSLVLPSANGQLNRDWVASTTNLETANESVEFQMNPSTLPAYSTFIMGKQAESYPTACPVSDTMPYHTIFSSAPSAALNQLPSTCTNTSDPSLRELPTDPPVVVQPELHRRRGRPPKNSSGASVKTFYSALHDPAFLLCSESNQDSPFWCPLCQNYTYESGTCKQHPIFNHVTDPLVESFARLSRPSSVRIVGNSESTFVCAARKLPPMTRFGPLIAPTVTQEEVNCNPGWQSHCRFPIAITQNGQTMTKFHLLNDEARCNWMMFVRLELVQTISPDNTTTFPNAVAYQHGSDGGIYFLTTRTLRSGEELVVTYAPPYAARFRLPQSLISTDSPPNFLTKPSTPSTLFKPVPDEIHCFQCSITFHSEDAFLIHCLGHSGEFERRGISIRPKSVDGSDLSRIEVHHSTGDEETSKINRLLLQPTLSCSVCSVEFQDLSELICHTDSQHSVLCPYIFRPKSFKALVKLLSAPVGFDGMESADNNFARLDDSIHSDTDLSMTDLNRISPPLLLDGPLYAYGCGQCREQFGTMPSLVQHKQSVHTSRAQTQSFTSTTVTSQLVQYLDLPQGTENWTLVDLPSTASVLPTPVTTASTTARDSETDLSCATCARCFRTKSALTVHRRSHHCEKVRTLSTHPDKRFMNKLPSMLEQYSLRPRFGTSTKRYFFQCAVCGEGQPNQKALQKHQIKHRRQSDHLYPCSLCGTDQPGPAYPTFAQLVRHTRFVHPKTLFPCPYCTRTFGRRQHLTNHLTRHTGQRDFVCPYPGCKKAYGRKDKLKNHMKSHHVTVSPNST